MGLDERLVEDALEGVSEDLAGAGDVGARSQPGSAITSFWKRA